MRLRARRWRWLIRKSRLERYLREQSELLAEQGAEEGGFVLWQVAENLRVGVSLSVKVVEEPTDV